MSRGAGRSSNGGGVLRERRALFEFLTLDSTSPNALIVRRNALGDIVFRVDTVQNLVSVLGDLEISGEMSSATLSATTLTATNLTATNATATNLTSTSATLTAATIPTLGSTTATISDLTATTATLTTATIPTLSSTNGTIGTLNATTATLTAATIPTLSTNSISTAFNISAGGSFIGSSWRNDTNSARINLSPSLMDFLTDGTTAATLSTSLLDLTSAAASYRIGGSTVLSATSLGSGVVSSSLTSVGTLSGGLNIASGQTYRVNGSDVLSATGLGAGVVSSSLTSVGTLTGLTVAGSILPSGTQSIGASGNPFQFVYASAMVPGVIRAQSGAVLIQIESFTGTDWLTIGPSYTAIPAGAAFRIGAVDILGSNFLASSVVTSSLTSVGVLTGLSMGGNISVASGSRSIGTAAAAFATIFGTAVHAASLRAINSGQTSLAIASDTGTAWLTASATATNIPSGAVFQINSVPILSAVGLGSSVVGSSLTSVGVLTSLSMGGDITVASGSRGIGTAVAPFATVFSSILYGGAVRAINAAQTSLAIASDSGVAWLTASATATNIVSGSAYQINGTAVLSSTTLGSTVVSSSLTSIGTIAAGINIASGQTYRINAVDVLSATTLGSTVVSSSLTSIGTIAAGINIASGQTYRINGTAVLSSTTLGSTVVSSSLTSIGTIAAGINIASGQTYRINAVDVLSATTLGASVTASSLTSLGTLTAVNTSGNVTQTRTAGSDGYLTQNISGAGRYVGLALQHTGTTRAQFIYDNTGTSLGFGLSSNLFVMDSTGFRTVSSTALGSSGVPWSAIYSTALHGTSLNTATTLTINRGATQCAILNASQQWRFGTGNPNGAYTVTIGRGDEACLYCYRATTSATANVISCWSDVDGLESAVIRMYADGDIQNADNSYGSLSDRRLKDQIQDAGPQLADVLFLGGSVRSYFMKNRPEFRQIGLVAQEIEAACPSLIRQNDEETMPDENDPEVQTPVKSVKYSIIAVKLLKAFKEFHDEHEELAAAHETLQEAHNELQAAHDARGAAYDALEASHLALQTAHNSLRAEFDALHAALAHLL